MFTTASDIISTRCPGRVSVFTRMPGYMFKPEGTVGVRVASREACQERCLKEASFVCRSASFDTIGLMCYLSANSMRNSPDEAVPHHEYDYLENNCITGTYVQYVVCLHNTVSTLRRTHYPAVKTALIRILLRTMNNCGPLLCNNFSISDV